VLVISGKAFPEEGDLPPSAVFLPKPVRPDALTAQIAALMTRSAVT
jgi:two-component system, response regulator PdtaR